MIVGSLPISSLYESNLRMQRPWRRWNILVAAGKFQTVAEAIRASENHFPHVPTKVFEFRNRLAHCMDGRRSLAYVAAAILVAGILVSATLFFVTFSAHTTTVTSTDFVTLNESGDKAILAGCGSGQVNTTWFGTLIAGTSSPAIICLQLYEFNPSPIIVNATSLLSIGDTTLPG
jgi:hypothetical protein